MANKLKRLAITKDGTCQRGNGDLLREPKEKIKLICDELCLESSSYDPKQTIVSIEKLLDEPSTKDRILYFQISSFVYDADLEQLGIFDTNLEKLLSYALSEDNIVNSDCLKVIVKFYDHFHLALRQKSLNEVTEKGVKDQLANNLDAIKSSVLDELKEDTHGIEKEYISILGIFAAIMLTFVGGMTFSTSVLNNINANSIYRLIFVIDFLAFVLINTIYLLLKFLWRINNKEKNKDKKLFCPILVVNIVLFVIAVGTVVAWLCSFTAIPQSIKSMLPWG